jgi:hypothetical protein
MIVEAMLEVGEEQSAQLDSRAGQRHGGGRGQREAAQDDYRRGLAVGHGAEDQW